MQISCTVYYQSYLLLVTQSTLLFTIGGIVKQTVFDIEYSIGFPPLIQGSVATRNGEKEMNQNKQQQNISRNNKTDVTRTNYAQTSNKVLFNLQYKINNPIFAHY